MKMYRLLIVVLYALVVGCTTTQELFEGNLGNGSNPSNNNTTSPSQNPATGKKDSLPNRIGSFPATNMLSNYQLGSGDLVSIKVFGENDLSTETRLSDGGTISYPLLGELQVSGLTIGELETKVANKLKEGYLVNPRVTVTILEYRQFFINGEVQKPGGYAFMPGLTVNKAISLAGGFSQVASHTAIYIIRDGQEKALPAGLNTFVQPGDIITVKESFF